MPDSDLLTSAEAAAILETSPRQVQRWADAGKLAFAQKLPGQTGAYLFHRSDVEATRDAKASA